MKVDGSIASLLQGVSQQPVIQRLNGQCTEQINMSSDPVSGLTRRPPSDFVADLGTTGNTHRGMHNFEVPDGRKFVCWAVGPSLNVYDLNGVHKISSYATGTQTYLGTAGNLRFCTVDNDTYISNDGVVCAMTTSKTQFANVGPGSEPSGIIQVLGGGYGRKYSIRYNGVFAAAYTVPDGSESVMTAFARTSWIAQQLVVGLTTVVDTLNPNGPGSRLQGEGLFADAGVWDVSRQEDIILIKRIDGGTTQFNIAVSDDAGNVNIKSYTDSTTDTSELSKYAPHGYLVRIATETNSEDDAFFQFIVPGTTTLGTNFGQNGYWQETTKQDITYQIDPATMPVILRYNPTTDNFSVIRGTWQDRRIGTYVSNPDPSFIGGTISDIATFQKRLVLLSGRNVIMSTSDDRSDFWFSSATQVIDTDPVDISSSALEANTMRAVIPFNKDLVIFSGKGQFVITGRSAITAVNAALVLTTAFEADLQARPVPSGRNIFFATRNGRYTHIREFYTEGTVDINDTRPISQHVKKYKVGRATHLASSSNYDKLFVLTDTDKNTIYYYEYLWSDTAKEQASWSKWTFADPVIHVFFDNDHIYVMCKNAASVYYLLRLSLDVEDTEPFNFAVHLDERFDAFEVDTQFALPSDRYATAEMVVVQGTGCPNPGMPVPILSVDLVGMQYIVTLKYDMLGGDCIVGIRYRSSYKPSIPQVKDADGIVVTSGTLTIREFIAHLQATGHCEAVVSNKYGTFPSEEFDGRIMNDPENIIGVPSVVDIEWVTSFRQNNNEAEIEFYSDSYMPMTIVKLDWNGQYSKSGKRITTGVRGG